MAATVFTRTLGVFTPERLAVRNMATLKDISMRLRSVKNIQKITKSMKMVSAAKYARAERELKPARVYGTGCKAFYEAADISTEDAKPNHLILAISSDRGLCGAIHSSVVRAIKETLTDESLNVKLVCVGDKARLQLQRFYADKILMSFNDIGKKPPTFGDAAIIASAILESGYEFDLGEIYYNTFRSVVSYRTTKYPLYSLDTVAKSESILSYDDVDADVLRSYQEYQFTSLIYSAMKEAACSEQSSRMTAMDAASKNAGEMIDKLTLTFNRTRQAVITKELIEIISGAAAI